MESHLTKPIEFVFTKNSNLEQPKELSKKTRQRRIVGLKDLI